MPSVGFELAAIEAAAFSCENNDHFLSFAQRRLSSWCEERNVFCIFHIFDFKQVNFTVTLPGDQPYAATSNFQKHKDIPKQTSSPLRLGRWWSWSWCLYLSLRWWSEDWWWEIRFSRNIGVKRVHCTKSALNAHIKWPSFLSNKCILGSKHSTL